MPEKVNADASIDILSAASPTPAITKSAEGTVIFANSSLSGSLEVILMLLIKSRPNAAFSFPIPGSVKESFDKLELGRLSEICLPNSGCAMFARPLGPSAILIGTTLVSGTFRLAKSC